jgi:hypothetical protein
VKFGEVKGRREGVGFKECKRMNRDRL